MFPILETDRLILREVKVEEAITIYSYFSKDEVTQYYGQSSFKHIDEAKKLIESFRKTFEDKRGIRWGIELKDSRQLVGTIGFHAASVMH